MKIIIAPASFKGCLSNIEAAEIIKGACLDVFPSVKTLVFPLADGGEGTLDVVKMLAGGMFFYEDVSDPLGRKIKGKWLKNKWTAYIEMAQAAGLTLLNKDERNPLKTTTYGVGELIKKAVMRGCKEIFIAVGGSATNDGGIGALTALGIRFFGREGKLIHHGSGKDLINIKEVDTLYLIPEVKRCEFTVLSDVENPLYGRDGAAFVYASQKGARRGDVRVLDEGLKNYNKIVKKATGIDMNNIEGAGAAGGLAGGLAAFLGAKITSGIEAVLQMGNFEDKIRGAELLITGEGRVDNQTGYGKGVGMVISICRRYNLPVVVLAGSVENDIYRNRIFKDAIILSIAPGVISLDEAMKKGNDYLYRTAVQVLKLYKKGIDRKNACKD